MTKENIYCCDIDKDVPCLFFDVPMSHEDYHAAENEGMVYAAYYRCGPDYWDDKMVCCPKEFTEGVQKEIWSWG